MDMLNNKLSIIMHTLERYDCLEDVLIFLRSQTVQPDEIVIADQTPLEKRPKGFYENYSDLPIKLLNLDRPSHAPAQNKAAKASSGDLLLFLDDDIEFSNDFIEQYLYVLETEHVDVVQGAFSDEKTLTEHSERDYRKMEPLGYFLKLPKYKWNGMVLATCGGSLLIKRELFLSVGGYDEKTPRMADIELGYRLFRHGAKIFFSEKPFAHHKRWKSGGTFEKTKDIAYIRLVSRFYIYQKHFPGWMTKQFVLHEFISALLLREFVSGKFLKKNMMKPYLPIIRVFQVITAYNKAKNMLQDLVK